MEVRPIEEVELNFVEDFSDVQQFFHWLSDDRGRNWLGFDTETTGLNPFAPGAALRLIQFGDVNTGWCFRADRWLGVAEQVFKNYQGRITGQNLWFDVRWTQAHSGNSRIEVPGSKMFDTKNMGHILDPTKSTSLKAMSARFLSPTAKKLQGALDAAMKAQKWTWATIPYDFDIYTMYAALDPVLTARIAEDFWPKIESEFLDVFELEAEVSRICSDMEVRGIRVDLTYCNEKYSEILEYTSNAEQWCLDNYGIRPGQSQEVAMALIREGIDLSKTTATGDWAMDADVLEGLDHPLAKTVLGHRKSTKIGSTYFRNYLEGHTNGFLHPSINTLGARTGRMTINNPAAQTLPRGRLVRDAFVPRDGSTWLCIDFSNIEMKLFAHFVQDPGLLDAARSSDMHLETARRLFNEPDMQKSDPRRQLSKGGNFAQSFVSGIPKFASTMGVTYDEGAEFFKIYDENFPGAKKFQKAVISAVMQRQKEDGAGRGWVRSPLGRKHYGDKGKEYACVNYLVQGTAAEAFKMALVDLDRSGYGEYMLLPVHDEQNFEIPTESAEELKHDIEEIMVRHNYSLPLTVEGSLGKSWGEAK